MATGHTRRPPAVPSSLPDRPKLLGDEQARLARAAELAAPHIARLTSFVHELCAEVGPDAAVPYFDPWDGGIDAECLFLLEAPGARAVRSGFVSRNNPDESAKNFFELNQAAGIPRSRTVTWNIVPWYLGTATRIRPATNADVRAGLPYLARLLALLPKLTAVVMVGRKAQAARGYLERARPDLRLFAMPHPSPMFVNRAPGNRARAMAALQEVAQFLLSADRPTNG